MERSQYGLTAAGEGWFVVNVRDGAWMTNERFGQACVFEGDAVGFGQLGYTLHVLHPGQPNGLYHREKDQEDFFVLFGECLLIVEGAERRLKAWDFVHCPPGTEHIFVGAGEGPCVIFMVGARKHRGEQIYTHSEAAVRHGAGLETETLPSENPYGAFPEWRAGPPSSCDCLVFVSLS